jgi:hypothetical protein
MVAELAHYVVLIVIFVLMIPISAIVLGIGTSIIKTITQSQERKLQMKLEAKNAAAGMSDSVVQDLRAEIALLRDTTTQHAMSLQHSLERLEHRVEFLERKTSGIPETMSEPPKVQQRIGL